MQALFNWIVVAILLVITGPAAATPASCPGDCDGNNEITIDELIIGVNIALGTESLASCASLDLDQNQMVTVDEILTSVTLALEGCAPPPTETPAATETATTKATATETATTEPTATKTAITDPTASETATAEPTATDTVAAETPTETPTVVPSEAPTEGPTGTPEGSETPTADPTATVTAETTETVIAATETPTEASAATPTAGEEPTASETETPTPAETTIPTAAVSETPVEDATATSTPAASETATELVETPTPIVETATAVASETPTETPVPSATDTPTPTVSATATETPNGLPSELSAEITSTTVALDWTPPDPVTGNSEVLILRRLNSPASSSTDGSAVQVFRGSLAQASDAITQLLPDVADQTREYFYTAYGCQPAGACSDAGVTTSVRPTLIDVLRAGGYTLHWRHASADQCADQLALGTAATTMSPNWWRSCNSNCGTATARQLNQTGNAESIEIGTQLRNRDVPFGRVLSSEFCRNFTTADLMNFGPPIEKLPVLTFFVYDEINRCPNSFDLIEQVPVAGTNTALIGHAGFSTQCPPLDTLAWGQAAIFKPDGQGGALFITKVLAGEWAAMPGL